MKKRVICYLSLSALVLMSAFVLFGSLVMAMIGKVEEKVTYVKPAPIYEEVEEIVKKDVYHQNAPTFPVKTTGKELILLDKSGSMKDFVTSLYTANIAFFTKHDVWAFDTEVYKGAQVSDMEFDGDTDIFKAVNMAADQGYNTIWLCSDLENTAGEIVLSDAAKKMTIIVYSPKVLDPEKSKETVEELKKCTTRVITIS